MEILIECPECKGNNSYRPWCNLCQGKGKIASWMVYRFKTTEAEESDEKNEDIKCV